VVGGTKVNERNPQSFTSVMTLVGVAVAVVGGASFTAMAVVAGDPTGSFVRFVLAVAFGVYYLYLYQLARGRRYFSTP